MPTNNNFPLAVSLSSLLLDFHLNGNSENSSKADSIGKYNRMSHEVISCRGTTLGKFTVEGSLTAQNLASSAQTLHSNWAKSAVTDHKCIVHCGEFGLRLESCRKDEGFESDTDSSERNSIPQKHQDVYHSDSFGESSSSANSSGSDSECDYMNPSNLPDASRPNPTERENYNFQDIVFCHSEPCLPKLIVWVVRVADHLEAIVFLCHKEDGFKQLLSKYQEINKQRKFNKRYRGSRSVRNDIKLPPENASKLEFYIPPPAEFADPEIAASHTLTGSTSLNDKKPIVMRSMSLINAPVVSVEPWNSRHAVSTRQHSLNHDPTPNSWNLVQKVDTNGVTHLNVDRTEAHSMPPNSSLTNDANDTLTDPQVQYTLEPKVPDSRDAYPTQIICLNTPEVNETPELETCEELKMKPLEFFRRIELQNQAARTRDTQTKPKTQPKVGKLQSTLVKDLEAVLEAQLKRRQLPVKPSNHKTTTKAEKAPVQADNIPSKPLHKRAESPEVAASDTTLRRGRSQTRFPHFKLLSSSKASPSHDNNDETLLASNNTPSATRLTSKPSFFRRERGRSHQRKATVSQPPPPPPPPMPSISVGSAAALEPSHHQQNAYLVPTKTGQEVPSKHAPAKEGRRMLPHPGPAAALYHPRYLPAIHPQPHFLPGHPVLHPWLVNVNDVNDVNNNRGGTHSLILIRPWWEEPPVMMAPFPACPKRDEETFEEKRRRSRSKSPARRSNRWMEVPFSLTTAMPEHLSQHHDTAGILQTPSSSKFHKIKEWGDSVIGRFNTSSKSANKTTHMEVESDLDIKDPCKNKDQACKEEMDRKVTFNDFATVQLLKSVN